MSREELRDIIEQNLEKAGINAKEIRIQQDTFQGWRVAVVSDDFKGRDLSWRTKVALQGVDDSETQWIELLTVEESEWAGPLFADLDILQSPTWPDALARANASMESKNGSNPAPTSFPSSLDIDLSPPISATFYSVRGGVGRSTALAYCARILANRGNRVVCVDLDLEAPGLASLFGVESQITPQKGVLPLLMSLDRGDHPDISEHLIRVTEDAELYCLPAGRPDAEYARLLHLIDAEAWYVEDRNPLRALVAELEKLPLKPNVLLFDARTGISEISGPLLFDLADLAIIVFFPHPQTRHATREVVRALVASTTRRSQTAGNALAPEPRFIVSPIPGSRVPEITQRYRNRAQEWIAEWIEAGNHPLPGPVSEAIHYVPYREEVATADTVGLDTGEWSLYEPVADWIDRFLTESDSSEGIIASKHKKAVLGELAFSAGTAEYQDNFLDTFVEASLTAKAMSDSMPLVLGRKGVGKTAIFRRLLEGDEHLSIPITAPAPLRSKPWLFDAEAFAEAENVLQSKDVTWRQFWTGLSCIACYYNWPFTTPPPVPDNSIEGLLPKTLGGPSDTLKLLEAIFGIPRVGLLLNEWFSSLEQSSQRIVLLLFDALDTGFGNSPKERFRRKSAIEGLCSLLVHRPNISNLRFKIVLREDIWRELQFENKSHLYGRYVKLDWREQTSYFKIVLKQALKSKSFADTISEAVPGVDNSRIDAWGDADVAMAWKVLIGERMKGEKTAFTRNWVWNRLADANEDHTPRYLLQLFKEATEWEREEEKKTPYDRSVLRPRALIQVLPTVSQQALDALREEFPELDVLLEHLRSIGRTPVEADQLSQFGEQVKLAREVGLLGVYEGTEDRVQRYRIPEIYRHALGMTRKGQA